MDELNFWTSLLGNTVHWITLSPGESWKRHLMRMKMSNFYIEREGYARTCQPQADISWCTGTLRNLPRPGYKARLSHVKAWRVYLLPRAAVTKYYPQIKPQKLVLRHGSGCWKSVIQMAARPCSVWRLWERICSMPFSSLLVSPANLGLLWLINTTPVSASIATSWSPGGSVCLFSFYKDNRHIGVGPTRMTSW